MSKLRVTEMAGEFGITADEVVGLLREMDVPVRGPSSPLSDDNVARLRARWEREKRVRAQKQSAPAATATRRRRAPTTAAPKAEAAPPPPAVVDSPARRRRRPAAEVQAAAEEQAAVAAAAEAAAAQAAAEAAEAAQAAQAEAEANEAELTAFHEPPQERFTPVFERDTEAPRGAAADAPRSMPSVPDRQRPRPVTPGAPRPRSMGGAGFVPPRPIASAAPGGGITTPARRDERKPASGAPTTPDRGATRRKKGKRGAVDQEAVDANISKTMAAMRGAPARRGGSDLRRVGREDLEAARAAEAERERKTVRVNEFITVSELAQILKVSPTEIVGFAFKNLGLMVTINQRLDFDQIELIAGEFGFQAVREDRLCWATDRG